MRKFRSHKVVEAAEVWSRDPQDPPRWFQVGGIEGQPTERLDVPASFTARGVPGLGDYIVRYEDGYLSWSPKKAFEEGYAPVE